MRWPTPSGSAIATSATAMPFAHPAGLVVLSPDGRVSRYFFGVRFDAADLRTVRAPDLDGLYGRIVHLQDGRSVVADEAYIRDSILLPKRDVVAGFEPVMPSFQGQASEGDILEIIANLKSPPGRVRP
jgi:hypothetical protein